MLDLPLRHQEFLAVDTETNGQAGDACELTEVGAVLVGGGELHDRWETLLAVHAPLGRGIQRFTGITQAMVDAAPPASVGLAELAGLLRGRVLVAHSAAFDRRVLRQAFGRAQIAWPDPPVLCTVALARRLAPLVRQRRLGLLAEALGIEVEVTHRALADAETCARVFCALFGRLCAHATTVGEAVALLGARRRRAGPGRATRATDGGGSLAGLRKRGIPTAHLPDEPGVYVFRNAAGQVLYVGKSTSLRTRARAHLTPSSGDSGWVAQVETVDAEVSASELGALLLEHRRIRELQPPGNVVHRRPDDHWVYLRCRLDIAYPVLEVAPEPAAGRAVNVGPLSSRVAAVELMEQLNSLFALRHCGRGLKRRPWASAYGQMGRCLSPCLGDLDPNAYRRRLDEALGLFGSGANGARALLVHVDALVAAASAAQRYERAATLRRRRDRMAVLLERLGGVLDAGHARPELVFAAHPRTAGRGDLVWLAGGRVAAQAELGEAAAPAPEAITARVLADRTVGPPVLTPEDVARHRIAATWARGADPPVLALTPDADVAGFVAAVSRRGAPTPSR